MTILKYANNATSALKNSINNSVTSIVLNTGGGSLFPSLTAGQAFYITILDATTQLIHEILLCTARTTDTLTVIRAQQGTTALAWPASSIVSQLVTASDMVNLVQIDQLQTGIYNFAVATGTGDSLLATIPSNSTTLSNGFNLIVESTAANTGAATLTLTLGSTSTGSFPIVKYNNTALSANDIPSADYPINLTWVSAWNSFVINNPFTTTSTANITGGAAKEIVYQTATNVTGFIAAPTSANQFLEFDGTNLVWSDTFNQQSLGTSGYQKLPGGLIIQWGEIYVTASGTPYSFPIAFPSICASVVFMGFDEFAGAEVLNPASVSSTGFVANATFTSHYQYIAVGY
jgi:hypothetical protein